MCRYLEAEAPSSQEKEKVGLVQGLLSFLASNATKEDKKARALKRKREEEEAPGVTFSTVRMRARSSAVKGVCLCNNYELCFQF